jgi:hypothetical protein
LGIKFLVGSNRSRIGTIKCALWIVLTISLGFHSFAR